MSSISNKRLRDVERVVHILGGFLLLLYVYAPLAEQIWFTLVIRVVVLPIVIGSGFAMWQLPRVRRWWNSRRAPRSRLA